MSRRLSVLRCVPPLGKSFAFAFGLLTVSAVLVGCERAVQPPLNVGSLAGVLGERKAFLVLYRPADAWPKGSPLPEQPRREHSEYLLALYRAGDLKFAGRFGDGSGGGMFFLAKSDEAARKMILADPAVVAGVFDFDLRPWLLADWEERAQTWSK